MLFGGVEAGGTKFVCVVGSGPDDIRGETRFPTTMPAA
jgi:fructokinase